MSTAGIALNCWEEALPLYGKANSPALVMIKHNEADWKIDEREKLMVHARSQEDVVELPGVEV